MSDRAIPYPGGQRGQALDCECSGDPIKLLYEVFRGISMAEEKDPKSIETIIEKIEEYLQLLPLGMRRVAISSLQGYIQEKRIEADSEWYSKFPEARRKSQN